MYLAGLFYAKKMKKIKYLLVLLVVLIPLATYADHQSKSKVRSRKKDKDPGSRSWIPIAGYNSTYGVFGGGGYFYNCDDLSYHAYGIVTQTKVA